MPSSFDRGYNRGGGYGDRDRGYGYSDRPSNGSAPPGDRASISRGRAAGVRPDRQRLSARVRRLCSAAGPALCKAGQLSAAGGADGPPPAAGRRRAPSQCSVTVTGSERVPLPVLTTPGHTPKFVLRQTARERPRRACRCRESQSDSHTERPHTRGSIFLCLSLCLLVLLSLHTFRRGTAVLMNPDIFLDVAPLPNLNGCGMALKPLNSTPPAQVFLSSCAWHQFMDRKVPSELICI